MNNVWYVVGPNPGNGANGRRPLQQQQPMRHRNWRPHQPMPAPNQNRHRIQQRHPPLLANRPWNRPLQLQPRPPAPLFVHGFIQPAFVFHEFPNAYNLLFRPVPGDGLALHHAERAPRGEQNFRQLRAAHTMPRLGVDEPVTQPLISLALHELRKRQRAQYRNRLSGNTGGSDISNPADFVANFLFENMTLEDFHNGNQPPYGPAA